MALNEPNADQKVYWNEGAGPIWAAHQALLDWQMSPLGAAAIAVLDPAHGERILDIGCGAGATAIDLAAAVGPSGAVLGVDLSEPMLDIARRRAAKADTLRVEFRPADAQTSAFEPGAFDAAFSRFGVMFFADPVAAFSNLRRALRPGGRLAFVCWRSMAENPIFTLPMVAALKHFDSPPAPPDTAAPGPFAFADDSRLQSILSRAGFEAIHIRPHDQLIGSRNLEDAMTLALQIGPLGGFLRAAPEKRAPVADAVLAAMTPYDTDRGCLLPSATWIAGARRPA